MKPIITLSLCIVLCLITVTGHTQKLGINTTTPEHNVDIRTPEGVQLTGYDAVLNVKYTGSHNDDVAAIKGESYPGSGFGIGGKFSGGRVGVSISALSFGLEMRCTPFAGADYGGTGLLCRYDGDLNGTNYGVKVDMRGNNSFLNYAVYGAASLSCDENIGIFGTAKDATTNWAGYFKDGNVYIKNKLGIGQLTPAFSLDILTNQAVGRFMSTSSVNGSVIELKNSTVNPILLGAINFGTGTSTVGQIAYDDDHNFTVKVNITERLRINSAGLVGLGRTPATNRLEVEGNASKSTAGDWLANSDERLKKNIQSLDAQEMIEKLLALKGITYEWNDDKTGNARPEGVQYGFTAQNIQEVFPTLVEEDAKGYLQTAYGTYDAMTIEAIRYLYTKIESLENELKEMKSSNKKEEAGK